MHCRKLSQFLSAVKFFQSILGKLKSPIIILLSVEFSKSLHNSSVFSFRERGGRYTNVTDRFGLDPPLPPSLLSQLLIMSKRVNILNSFESDTGLIIKLSLEYTIRPPPMPFIVSRLSSLSSGSIL